MEFQKISQAEYDVMEVLWHKNEPMTSAQIIEELGHTKAWKQSTVWTFLGRLVEKSILTTVKKVRTNYYQPTLTEADYKRCETEYFINQVHGGSVRSFIASLGGGQSLSATEIDELKKWIKSL